MVAFNPPESPRRRKREVDTLSLDGDDLDSIKIALDALFDAAVELDNFLANESTEANDDVNSVQDDSSFASEEQRLHESEAELRKALDSIHDSTEDETSDCDDVASVSCERLDAFSAESYESPETQVPLLQAVSPFGSPFSESSSTPSKPQYSPVLEVARIHSPNNDSPRKRQVRPYGLRKRAEETSFVDLESSVEKLDSPKGDGASQIMANALFGRSEYSVRPVFSSREYKRTVQGTISVLLASGITVADHAKSLPLLFALFIPFLIAAIQVKLPHQLDETILAIVMLGSHVAYSYFSVLHVV